MPKKLSKEDWFKIEMEYRKGVMQLTDIARKYNITPQHLSRRAKDNLWTRDLNDEIQAKAAAMVRSAHINDGLDNAHPDMSVDEITDLEASKVAAVQKRHRTIAENLSKSAEQIVAELQESTDDTFTKARMFQMITTGFKTLVEIERKSYGMDSAESKIAESAKTAGIQIEFVEPEDGEEDS